MSTALPRLRRDLEVLRMPAGAGVRVRDPVRARYWEFTEEQWQGAERLSAVTDLRQWLQQLVVNESDRRSAVRGWTRFLSRLSDEGLLREGRSLSSNEPTAPAWWRNPWAIRVGAIGASPWVDRLYRFVRPLLSSTMLRVWSLLLIVSFMSLLANLPKIIDEGQSITQWLSFKHLVWLPLIVGGVKVVHELGHALIAKHVGGGCREIGLMLFCGSPCLYADVSEVWMIASRRARMAVTLGGTAFESLIAAAAIWIWWGTQPGLLHALSWFVIVGVIAGNLLLNLNPLMRYDGYYLLSDAVGIPNLHAYVRQQCERWWIENFTTPFAGRFIFWRSNSDANRAIHSARTPSYQSHWVAFGLAAWAYRVVILSLMIAALIFFLSPLGLGWAAGLLGAAWILSSVVVPGWRGAVSVAEQVKQQSTIARRAPWRLSLLMVALIVGLCWPWPGTIDGRGVMRKKESQPIYAEESGRMVAGAMDRESLAAGDSILQLENLELISAADQLRTAISINSARLDGARRYGADDRGESVAALDAQQHELERQLQLLERRIAKLELVSPESGMLFSTRVEARSQDSRLADPAALALSDWSGDPLHRVNQGGWIEAGTLIGWVVPKNGVTEVWGTIDEAELSRVKLGDRATLRVPSMGYRSFSGHVVSIGTESGYESDQGKESWSEWTARLTTGSEFESKVGQIRIELSSSATAELADGGDPVGVAFQDEPVQIRLTTQAESLINRAWRWGERQVYWPW